MRRSRFTSFKSVDVHTVLVAIKAMFEALSELLQNGRERASRTWRFSRDRFGRKALNAEAQLAPEPGTVAALGDWRPQHVVRGTQRVSLSVLTEALLRRSTVVLAGICRTIKLCLSCFCLLEQAVYTNSHDDQTTLTTTTRDVLK